MSTNSDTNYKSISQLDRLDGIVSLDDLVLISRAPTGTTSEYASQRASVRNFAGTLSSEISPAISSVITSQLKRLAYMDPSELNRHPEITSYVIKSISSITAPKFTAISSIHWREGIIDEIGTVALSDAEAEVTDINTKGDPIAKIDGTQIYNGLDVEQTSKDGFEIAKINGTSIYAGSEKLEIERATQRGLDVATVTTSSPAGSSSYTIKNGVDFVPTTIDGISEQVGTEIFKYNDIPIYNNVSVMSLVSNTNNINDPIADINGAKIYNGVNIGNMTTVGQTIATINGKELKNGINIDPNDFKTQINIDSTLKGTTIATVDGKPLKNGVNVDNEYSVANGVKIANIAGADLYAPGTDLTALVSTGEKIAKVKTGNGSVIDLFSGTHPHVHITQAEYDSLKKSNKLDANTYYFTEGRKDNSGYDDVAVLYRYRSAADLNGCYTWFEIWPDGWCVQGGKIISPNYTYNVKFSVPMADTTYFVNANAEMSKNYGAVGTCAHFNPIVNTYTTTGFTMQTCQHFSHEFWEVKGYCDETKISQVLTAYPAYTKTAVGITTVKQTYSTGSSVVGQIVAYGGANVPEGWLLCDGTAVSKTTYSDLYAVIGNSFGKSSDSDKFILPKLTDARYLQGHVTPGIQYADGLPDHAHNYRFNFAMDDFGDGYPIHGSSSACAHKSNVFKTMKVSETDSSLTIYGAATTVRPKSLTVRYIICWKDVSLTDCKTYIITNWHNADKNCWCRIYSDGFCEQGGKAKITEGESFKQIILHQSYINTDYTITASPCSTKYDGKFGIVGNDQTHPLSRNAFFIKNELNTNDWIMWETKGYMK